eukprot:50008-Eustigmatos_ZCMA.PRE.1
MQPCHLRDAIDVHTALDIPQCATGEPLAPPQSLEGVAGAVETLEVSNVPWKRHREQGSQDGQPRAHHHHSAAAAT